MPLPSKIKEKISIEVIKIMVATFDFISNKIEKSPFPEAFLNAFLDKLMGKGNSESADAIIARDTNVFVVDTLLQQKLEQVKPNFKTGETWTSSYLKDIITIRNNDWKNLLNLISEKTK